jgi:hypothetical protein
MDNIRDKPPPKPPDSAEKVENKVSANPAPQPGKPNARAYLSNQNQTSAYEEYLYGNGTYIKGTNLKAWNDTTQGRSAVRLISRGIFGAAAFVWGGRIANKSLQNYHPDEFVAYQNLVGKLGLPIETVQKIALEYNKR